MSTHLKNLAIALTMLLLIGCTARSGSPDATQTLTTVVQLAKSPGLEFRQTGRSSGATGNGSACEVFGEIVSTNGSLLPPHLAENIADTIRTELDKQGWKIIGSGRRSGHYLQQASVDYSLGWAGGNVEVLVIERDYMPDPKTKVVGQLVLRLNSK